MKGFGIFVVSTTVLARLFAVTVEVGGTATPKYGERFAGLAMNSRFRLTTEAVIAVPSAHLTPRRSVSSTRFGASPSSHREPGRELPRTGRRSRGCRT